MKTPMQELLDELKVDRADAQSDSAIAYIDALIEYIETDLVPYEKEVMCEFALLCTSNGSLHEIDYVFNETFKTKSND